MPALPGTASFVFARLRCWFDATSRLTRNEALIIRSQFAIPDPRLLDTSIRDFQSYVDLNLELRFLKAIVHLQVVPIGLRLGELAFKVYNDGPGVSSHGRRCYQ